jgi:LmbE family N-acetylglucosaminyl deacetylase
LGDPPASRNEDLEACRERELHAVAEIIGFDAVLDVSRWRDRRAAALRAHRTQHLGIRTEADFRVMGRARARWTASCQPFGCFVRQIGALAV